MVGFKHSYLEKLLQLNSHFMPSSTLSTELLQPKHLATALPGHLASEPITRKKNMNGMTRKGKDKVKQ